MPTLDELNRTATTSPSNIPSAPFTLNADELLAAFTNFLQFDVGSGGASAETIRTYWCEVRYYLLWCETNQLQPLTVTRDQIKIYRHHLVSKKYKPTTISLKLVAVILINQMILSQTYVSYQLWANLELKHLPAKNSSFQL